jgi:hypothetical protein
VLLEFSRNDAKLKSERPLPNTFYVMLRPDLKRWCKVTWRRQDQFGVKFIADPIASAPITAFI